MNPYTHAFFSVQIYITINRPGDSGLPTKTAQAHHQNVVTVQKHTEKK